MVTALHLAAALALAAQAGAAPAPQSPSAIAPPARTAQVKASPDDEMICKSVAVTGTRFASRQCMTKAEWAKLARDAREFVDKATNPVCTVGCTGTSMSGH